jgi:hypothetical protein
LLRKTWLFGGGDSFSNVFTFMVCNQLLGKFPDCLKRGDG